MQVQHVGLTQFAIPQANGQWTNLAITDSETTVRFTRVGQTQIQMSVSLLFTPASIAIDPAENDNVDFYSVIDFLDHDVYVQGATISVATAFDSNDRAMFSINTSDLTVFSDWKDKFGTHL